MMAVLASVSIVFQFRRPIVKSLPAINAFHRAVQVLNVQDLPLVDDLL